MEAPGGFGSAIARGVSAPNATLLAPVVTEQRRSERLAWSAQPLADGADATSQRDRDWVAAMSDPPALSRQPTKAASTKREPIHIIRHDPTEAPALTRFVTGAARPHLVVGAEHTDELRVFLVRFDPRGRNLRHTHSFDQVLYGIDGERIAATDTDVDRLRPGDFAVIPANEPHWHGATEEGPHTQLAFGIPGSSDFNAEQFTASE
jgi:quercetin dioxygenase-like cupin family protein